MTPAAMAVSTLFLRGIPFLLSELTRSVHRSD
jgi:hypothetical protein